MSILDGVARGKRMVRQPFTRRTGLARCLAVLCWAAMVCPVMAAGPVVLLVGPPGSGRTTQAEFLKNSLRMPVIAAQDLIERNQQKFQKYKMPALQGVSPHLDPALNGLVEEALRGADLSKGLVFDGYPASKIQADFLTDLGDKLKLPPPVVIHLSAPDEVVRKRLKNQARPELEQELKDYHREFDFLRTYFPEANIRTVDATKRRADVAKEIRKIVQGAKQ
jgi:adenylate kinase family enzyme